MSEKKVKEKRPIDKTSANYLLGQIVVNHYKEAKEAKENGEMVGWCASNWPQEIFETLGLKVVYPENQAAAIAARGEGGNLCEYSESKGYSNDICAYARISLAYMDLKDVPAQNMPQPDFLLCCNNICNCMIKWYENIAKELNIPMILIDIPFNPDYEVSEAQIDYVEAQFWDAVEQLEEITGKKWSDEKFKEVMEISNRTSRAWIKATEYSKYKPSPFNGFDLMNHMAVAVCARGKVEAAEAFEKLVEEYEENVREGRSTFKGEEKQRIMFEGIACWPHLRATYSGLKNRGMNMVSTIYADAFGYIYDDFRGLIEAYCKCPNGINIDLAKDKRVRLAKQSDTEGLLVHMNRSCKLWSGITYEISRQVGQECGIPVSTFDGDQADPRNFSEAQYDTRVQALSEIISEKQEAKK